jgi:cobalt-zinc-cadmium efflux system outer membrane protein
MPAGLAISTRSFACFASFSCSSVCPRSASRRSFHSPASPPASAAIIPCSKRRASSSRKRAGGSLAAAGSPIRRWRAVFRTKAGSVRRTMMFGIEQSFPITKRLRLEKQLTSQLVTAAEFEVRDAERRLIAEARAHCGPELLALDQQRALRQQQGGAGEKALRVRQEPRGERRVLAAGCRAGAGRCAAAHSGGQKARNRACISLLGQLKPMLGVAPQENHSPSAVIFPRSSCPASRRGSNGPTTSSPRPKSPSAQTDAALAHSKRLQDVSAGFFGGSEKQDQCSWLNYASAPASSASAFPFRCRSGIATRARSLRRKPPPSASGSKPRLLGKQIASEADTARK